MLRPFPERKQKSIHKLHLLTAALASQSLCRSEKLHNQFLQTTFLE